MKALISSLVVVSALVTACSSGGGGNNGGVDAIDFKPFSKPADAAPEATVEQILALIDASDKHIPKDAAIFNQVLEGANIVSVNSYEKDAAISKLTDQARVFLNSDLKNCTGRAFGTGFDKEPQPGIPLKKELDLKYDGVGCPYLISDNVKNETNGSVSGSSVSFSIKQASSYYRRLSDTKVIAASGLKMLSAFLSAESSATGSNANDVVATASGSGYFELLMADDDSLKGPVTVSAVMKGAETKLNILFEGKVKQGAVRMVYMADSKNGTKIYINGTEVPSEKVKKLEQLSNILK